MMYKETTKIKPHHFIDIIASFGEGFRTFLPHEYKHEVHTISKNIIDNNKLILEIYFGIDDICKPCIHNINGFCDDNR